MARFDALPPLVLHSIHNRLPHKNRARLRAATKSLKTTLSPVKKYTSTKWDLKGGDRSILDAIRLMNAHPAEAIEHDNRIRRLVNTGMKVPAGAVNAYVHHALCRLPDRKRFVDTLKKLTTSTKPTAVATFKENIALNDVRFLRTLGLPVGGPAIVLELRALKRARTDAEVSRVLSRIMYRLKHGRLSGKQAQAAWNELTELTAHQVSALNEALVPIVHALARHGADPAQTSTAHMRMHRPTLMNIAVRAKADALVTELVRIKNRG